MPDRGLSLALPGKRAGISIINGVRIQYQENSPQRAEIGTIRTQSFQD